LGIKLCCLGITQDKSFMRETTADVPEGRREGTTRFALWPVAPEEADQPIPGLGAVAVEDEVGQQGLRLEGGRLGQLLVIVADVQCA